MKKMVRGSVVGSAMKPREKLLKVIVLFLIKISGVLDVWVLDTIRLTAQMTLCVTNARKKVIWQ